MRFRLSLVFAALSLAGVSAAQLARDEEELMRVPFDFSPPEERALDERLLMPPDKEYDFPEARVKVENGVRGISISGKMVPNWSKAVGASSLPGASVERLLREQGMRLYIVDVGLTSDYNEERTLDNAPDAAFAQFQKSVDNLLNAVPDARIIIRFWMASVGKDFVDKYPDALLQGPKGEVDWGFAYPPATRHQSRPNMLNEWRRYCGEHIYKFVHRLGESDYASHVAGFYLAAMNSGEWWFYKGSGDPGWDYSPTRRVAFESFVKHKYGDDPGAISKAWGETLEDGKIELPTLSERERKPLLPNSANLDYLQVLNMPVTNAADYFAKIIKTATAGKSLVGMEIHMGGTTYPNNGTVFMNHLLDSRNIDFFGGPSEYDFRRPGGSPHYRIVSASSNVHGKLWLNEGDYRTHMAFDTLAGGAGEPPMTPEGTRNVLLREFSRGAIFNYATYLMEFGWNWFYEPTIIENVGEILRADKFVSEMGLRRDAEIAVVTDQESQLFGNYFANPTMQMLNGKLDRIGASWDFFELRDLLANDRFRNYKMIIFLNACALSDGERNGIEKLKSDGRLLLWMYDPGVVDLSQRGRDAADLVSDLTGLRMKKGTRPGVVTLSLEALEKAGITKGGDLTLGGDGDVPETKLNKEVSLSDTSVGMPIGNLPSRIYSIDEGATVLGEDAAGRAFVAMRKFPDWTSVYTAFCEMDPWLVRGFARMAGCHVWSDSDDVVFAAENYVAIHAESDGEKTLSLPKASGVFDVFKGTTVATETHTIRAPMKKGETSFFYLGDAKVAGDVRAAIRASSEKEAMEFVSRNQSPMVPEAQWELHLPKPPEKTGQLALVGIHRFQAPAILFSGPFASDPATIEVLDDQLAQLRDISGWQASVMPAESFGQHSDRYLRVVKEQDELDASTKLNWFAVKNPASWVNDYQLGINTGQSYAMAFFLEASDKASVLLFLATRGDAAVWVDGNAVLPNADSRFEIPMDLNRRRKLVVIRIRGDEKPTGFTFKIAAAERGRGIHSIAGSGVSRLAPDDGALNPPPEDVMFWLPEKEKPALQGN